MLGLKLNHVSKGDPCVNDFDVEGKRSPYTKIKQNTKVDIIILVVLYGMDYRKLNE